MAKNTVINANIDLHTKLASKYNETEPHFRPENKAKTRARILEITKNISRTSMLDIGCGSGFIFSLIQDEFEKLYGIDITQAMLERVDTSSGKINLQIAQAENLPFAQNMFDLVTGYSVLDHFEDFVVIFEQAYRVLKPGGVLYFDLIPNQKYWQALKDLPLHVTPPYADIIHRELNWFYHNEDRIEEQFGVDKTTFQTAEPYKARGGFAAPTLKSAAETIGFSHIEIHFDWFLGEAKYLHEAPEAARSTINGYLERARPLTEHLFKYLWVSLVK
jgi:ubiquinone/menaquinone biosynthesis C-methylase UbiE